ncbi:hypothetical protein EDD86DRAFT_246826 [Gorgonomyces haynaldii]|nr:hypothetical protein EDD86DRAFT_246826 [Gorgonomyces haynaldii]
MSLPPGYIQQFDPQSGHYFYVNTATGQSQWEHPGPTISSEPIAEPLQSHPTQMSHSLYSEQSYPQQYPQEQPYPQQYPQEQPYPQQPYQQQQYQQSPQQPQQPYPQQQQPESSKPGGAFGAMGTGLGGMGAGIAGMGAGLAAGLLGSKVSGMIQSKISGHSSGKSNPFHAASKFFGHGK